MRALLSVSDRTGLVDFARGLVAQGFELVATGGTAKALEHAGLPVRSIDAFTGLPEMLGGRVKTLHPKVHGGILARPARDEDAADVARAGLELIDVVVVNLYPFERTVAGEHTFDEAIEQIDVGGPAMLRAAAKNAARVLPVCRPADYPAVLAALEEGVPDALRRRLQRAAFATTAAYDAAISEYLSRGEALPEVLPLVARRDRSLRYGENPHQAAALYRVPGRADVSVADAEVLQGKELSYNNLLDAAAAVACLVDVPRLGRPAAVVVKHGIPCGVAIADTSSAAYRAARDADAVSAFGGIVALTEEVDRATAALLAETFLEVVVAPAFSVAALDVLAAKKNLRLLALPGLVAPVRPEGLGRVSVRSVPGGLLVQERDLALAPPEDWQLAAGPAPLPRVRRDLALAWAVCKHVRSNAIVLAQNGVVVGVGPGQPNRLDSVRIAVSRAGELAKGAVLASDAFFPFADGVEAAAEAGIIAVVQPGGSVRDAEVVAAAEARGVALLLTGERHFQH